MNKVSKKMKLIFFLIYVCFVCKAQSGTKITGYIGSNESGYLVCLHFASYNNELLVERDFIVKTIDGFFKIDLPADRVYYIWKLFVFKGGETLNWITAKTTGGSPFWDFSTLPYIIEPGDSIHIRYTPYSTLSFSGIGAEKFIYRQKQSEIVNQFRKKHTETWSSGWAYFDFLDSLENLGLKVLQDFKSNLTRFDWIILKADIENWKKMEISDFVYYRGWRKDSNTQKSIYDPDETVKKVYEDKILMPTIFNKTIENDTMSFSYCYCRYILNVMATHYMMLKQIRKAILSEEERNTYVGKYYHIANTLYNGFEKDLSIAALLVEQLGIVGLSSELEYYIKQYLNDPMQKGVFKSKVQSVYERTFNVLSKDSPVLPISNLESSSGNLYSIEYFKGKVVLFDLWFTGCQPCLSMVPYLKMVKETFKDNKNVVFLSISVDKNKYIWKKNLPVYAPDADYNLFTNGEGDAHPWIKRYQISGYPRLMLMGKNGKMHSSSPPLPMGDNGKALITMIDEALKRVY